MPAESPAVLENSRCRRVCLFCEPEDGAWIVGAYTLILGIVGLLLLIAIEVWSDFRVFGPIGIVLSILLFVAGFLLFYGLYRRQVWWLYAWLFIFLVNFISHVVVWSLTIADLIGFLHERNGLEEPYASLVTNNEQLRLKFRFYIAEVVAGCVCLILGVWCILTVIAVRRRMDFNAGYIMGRPFSFIVRNRHASRSDGAHHTKNLSFVNFRKSSTPDPLQMTPNI